MTKQYFVYDPHEEIEFFATEDEALEHARKVIDDYLYMTEWSDGVSNIVVGTITHRATRTNVVTPDMLEDGEYNGRYYSGNYDDWCDYEMLPVEDTGEPNR